MAEFYTESDCPSSPIAGTQAEAFSKMSPIWKCKILNLHLSICKARALLQGCCSPFKLDVTHTWFLVKILKSTAGIPLPMSAKWVRAMHSHGAQCLITSWSNQAIKETCLSVRQNKRRGMSISSAPSVYRFKSFQAQEVNPLRKNVKTWRAVNVAVPMRKNRR